MKTRKIVTVVIRDDVPLIHCGDVPSFRTVRFSLTNEQELLLDMHREESVSRVILEDAKESSDGE